MNKKLKILFLHGMHGRPDGTKSTFLIAHGYDVKAPTLPKTDMFNSIHIAEQWLDYVQPDLVVGSSRGGAIVAHLKTDVPKIMIAPAYKAFALEPRDIRKTDIILHCKSDGVVPYNFSKELAQATECRLIDCGENHRMSDNSALTHLLVAIGEIINND